MPKDYHVLLYYNYTPIADTQAFWQEHFDTCIELDLLGRIIIAEEGLNGTVSGTPDNCQAYMDYVHSLPGFESTDFKIDTHDGHAFKKLNIRIKDEIVNSGLEGINPSEKTGKHLSAEEFKKLKEDPNVVILDVRSDYEYQLGKFKGARTLPIENFRDFKDHLEDIEDLKEKKVITYCTGGIKCEKASAYLLEHGFEDVYQLHGGIIKYGQEGGGEDFEGKCYVFDHRVAVDVNQVNPTVIAECHICGTKTERMVNCANPECNIHVPICPDCGVAYAGACSTECMEHPKKRAYRPDGYYQKGTNGYSVQLSKKNRAKDLKSG